MCRGRTCVCMYMQACMHMHVCIGRGQSQVSLLRSRICTPCLFRQGLPWSWNSPIRLGWPTNKSSGSFASASPAHDTTPAFPHEMEGFKPLSTSTYWETRRVLNEPKGGRIQKTTEVKKRSAKLGLGSWLRG